MTPEQLEVASNVLVEVARTLAVISIAQALTSARSDEERIMLSRSLSEMLASFKSGRFLGGGFPQHQEGQFDDPRYW